MDTEQSQLNQERQTASPPKYSTDPAAPPPYPSSASSDEIKRDIEHTRSEMDETLAAISERLRPSNLVREFLGGGSSGGNPPRDTRDPYDRSRSTSSGSSSSVVSSVLSSVAGSLFSSSKEPSHRQGHSSGYRHNWDDGGSSSFGVTSLLTGTAAPAAAWAGKRLLKFASHHPVPAAVIAAGVGWYIYESTRSEHERIRDEDEMYSGSYVDARTGQPYDRDSYGRDYDGPRAGRPAASGTYGSASVRQDASGNVYEGDADRDYDDESGEGARSRIGRASDRARGAVSGAASSAGYAAGSAGHAVTSAASSGGRYVADSATSAGRRVSGAASYAGHRVAGSASAARRGLSSAGHRAYESGRHAGGAIVNGVYYTAEQIAHGTSVAAESVKDGAQATGGAILDGVHYTTEQLSEGAATLAEYLQYGYEQSTRKTADALHEYPFAVGIAAMALGALAGLAIPETRKEHRLMGETRNDLLKRAKMAGRDYYESGKHVAESTLNAAAGEADAQGLTTTDLKSRVKGVASHLVENVKDSVKRTIQEEHLTPEEIKARAEKVVNTAKDTAKEEADKEGLTDAEKAKKHAEAAKQDVKEDVSHASTKPS